MADYYKGFGGSTIKVTKTSRGLVAKTLNKKKAKSNQELTQEVARIKRNVPKPEWKVIYTHGSSIATYVTGLGTFTLINGCNQGDGQSSRDGRQILNKSVEAEVRWSSNTSTVVDNVCRMILFVDMEPHGVAPTAAELLNLSSPSFGPEEAPRNLDNRGRFIILKDKKFISPGHPPYSSSAQAYVRTPIKYRKLNFKTTFDASNNADITDIVRGALYIWVYSASTTNDPTVDLAAKVRFIEI